MIKKIKILIMQLLPHFLFCVVDDFRYFRIRYFKKKAFRSALQYYYQNHNTYKLQIGSQSSYLDGWINTDISTSKGIYFLDATQAFDIESETFNIVFAEHFIEHISLQDFRFFLSEVYRILKPKGVVRFSTPDLQFVFDLYSSHNTKNDAFIQWYTSTFHPDEHNFTIRQKKVIAVNGYFHNFDHKFLYDYNFLKNELLACGFTDVTKCTVGKSNSPELKDIERHDSQVPSDFNKMESLVVEAVK